MWWNENAKEVIFILCFITYGTAKAEKKMFSMGKNLDNITYQNLYGEDG